MKKYILFDGVKYDAAFSDIDCWIKCMYLQINMCKYKYRYIYIYINKKILTQTVIVSLNLLCIQYRPSIFQRSSPVLFQKSTPNIFHQLCREINHPGTIAYRPQMLLHANGASLNPSLHYLG